MITQVYAIRDKAAGLFMFPQQDINDMTAKRNFFNAMESHPDGIMAFQPQDFDLYHIGTFDNEKAEFSCSIPEFIANGEDYYESE